MKVYHTLPFLLAIAESAGVLRGSPSFKSIIHESSFNDDNSNDSQPLFPAPAPDPTPDDTDGSTPGSSETNPSPSKSSTDSETSGEPSKAPHESPSKSPSKAPNEAQSKSPSKAPSEQCPGDRMIPGPGFKQCICEDGYHQVSIRGERLCHEDVPLGGGCENQRKPTCREMIPDRTAKCCPSPPRGDMYQCVIESGANAGVCRGSFEEEFEVFDVE